MRSAGLLPYRIRSGFELLIAHPGGPFFAGRDKGAWTILKGALSPNELDYLTEIDQRRHVAWGAVVGDMPAGVGRYIVDDEGCAEVAVTVVDKLQRQGLGRALFTALVAVARADGVESICFEALPENLAVQRMFRGLPLELDAAQGMVTGRVETADLPTSSRDAEFLTLMDRFRAGP